MQQSTRPAKRLRAKTLPPVQAQEPLAELPEFAEGRTSRRRSRYIWFPSLTRVRLRAPGTLTREGLFERFKDACARPVYLDAFSRARGFAVPLEKAVTYREFHKPDPSGIAYAHFHLAVLALRQFRFMAVKRKGPNLGVAP